MNGRQSRVTFGPELRERRVRRAIRKLTRSDKRSRGRKTDEFISAIMARSAGYRERR